MKYPDDIEQYDPLGAYQTGYMAAVDDTTRKFKARERAMEFAIRCISGRSSLSHMDDGLIKLAKRIEEYLSA